jgi:hypothetical protein
MFYQRRAIFTSVLLGTLTACSGGLHPMSPAVPSLVASASQVAAKETIYALNTEPAATIAVYASGAKPLRSITLGPIDQNLLSRFRIATGGTGLLDAEYPMLETGDSLGTMDIFRAKGAKKTASIQLSRNFSLLTVDSKSNAYTLCKNFLVCVYSKAGKLIRKLNLRGDGFGIATAIAVDRSGDLALTDGFQALIFEPGSSTPTWKIPSNRGIGDGVSLAFDSSDNLYVANGTQGGIAVYTLGDPFPTRTITAGVSSPIQVAVDSNDNLYVLNSAGPSVTEYAPGQTKPDLTITSGLSNPSSIALDASGTLYVSNKQSGSNSGSIAIYAPANSAPTRTITAGLHTPSEVAVSP